MTLGERITALRSNHHMSQGDLAERLGVSRQSISKWETNSSVPDLDKLIALSEIFGITLDDLVKGKSESQETPPQDSCIPHADGATAPDSDASFAFTSPSSPNTQATKVSDTQRTIGFILIAVGLFSAVLGLLFSPSLLFLCLIFVLFGVICLTVKRHAGLLIGWLILVSAFFLLPFVTGVTPLGIVHLLRHLGHAAYNLYTLLTLLYWLCVLAMAIFTWRVLKKGKQK